MEHQKTTVAIRAQWDSKEAAAFCQLDFGRKITLFQKISRFLIFVGLPLAICGLLISSIYSGGDLAPKGPFDFVWCLIIFTLILQKPLCDVLAKKKGGLIEEYSGVWEFIAKSEGLAVRYSKRQKLIKWEQIGKAEVDEGSLFLKLDNGEHLIVPKTKVLAGDYDEFISAVQKEIRDRVEI